MDTLPLKILESYGFPSGVLVAVLIVTWRLAKGVGPVMKEWGDTLLRHFVESARARDTALAAIITQLNLHEVSSEKRHQDAMLSVIENAKETRHDVKNGLTRIYGEIDGSLEQMKDRVEREARYTRQLITKTEEEGKNEDQ